MRRISVWLPVLALGLGIITGCGRGAGQSGEAEQATEGAEQLAIRPLTVLREAAALTAVRDAEPWGRYWVEPNALEADLSAAPGLAYSLIVGDNTVFNGPLPEGYDPEALLEWGKDPGLNVDILHAHGFTGKGAVIAYVDQGILPHEEYDRENIHLYNTGLYPLSYHGPAVLSLLAGERIGVAPEAEVFFLGFDSERNHAQFHEANCLYELILLNTELPEREKITMVGFSDNISPEEAHEAEFRAAVKACEEAGIMVWFCGDNGAVSFLPGADKNDPANLMPEHWYKADPSLACVPSSGRTIAATGWDTSYIYSSTGGLSWTMPYTLGLYAIASSIDPSLTQYDMQKLIRDTAWMGKASTNAADARSSTKDMRIVDPVAFVAAVLEGVGRNAEAEELRAEVRARQKYLYAVVDREAMGPEDQAAICDYLAWITGARVLVADASRFASPEELWEAVYADALDRGGQVVGVQLFGDESQVPELPAGGALWELFARSEAYRADELGILRSDKDPARVLRLSLEPGEYTAFFREYQLLAQTGDLTGMAAMGTDFFPPNAAGMAISTAEGELG